MSIDSLIISHGQYKILIQHTYHLTLHIIDLS